MAEEGVPRQVLLEFPVQPRFTFDSFIETPSSRFALNLCRTLAESQNAGFQSLFLHGGAGSGKTHLLLAMGNRAGERGTTALYVPCASWAPQGESGSLESGADWTQRLAGTSLLLMDDVDHLAARPRAQEIVYEAYNRLKAQGGRMVFSARLAPESLPDTRSYLTSRFQWGLTAGLGPLDDAGLERVLKKLAQDLGLEIPDAVSRFLIHRLPRDYPALKKTVDRLNRASLEQKCRVTLPWVKSLLDL